MGLETGTYINDLVTTNPVGAVDTKAQGDDHIRLLKTVLKNTLKGMAGAAWRVQSKSAGYTVALTDNMSVILCTEAVTISYTSAATLGNGHVVVVRNASAGSVVVDPDGAETINSSSTLTLAPNQFAMIMSTGSDLIAEVDNIDVSLTLANVPVDAGAKIFKAQNFT